MIMRDFQWWPSIKFLPFGFGAIAGSTLPLDREYVVKALGFVDDEGNACLTANGMDAVADRDLFLEFASACSMTALHLSRLSEDLILWNSSEFGFISLPDEFTTGSSLMPQKKTQIAMNWFVEKLDGLLAT